MYILIIEQLAIKALLDFGYWPIWWYSVGAKRAAFWSVAFFKRGNENLAPWLWLKNIFVPMYGQYDWPGRLISFFMRLFQTLIRGLALLAWSALGLALFIIYLIWPIILLRGLIRTL